MSVASVDVIRICGLWKMPNDNEKLYGARGPVTFMVVPNSDRRGPADPSHYICLMDTTDARTPQTADSDLRGGDRGYSSYHSRRVGEFLNEVGHVVFVVDDPDNPFN